MLEIGSRQASEKSRKIRIGIDSCAAVTVFPTTRRLQAQGKAKSYSPAPDKLLRDLGARKVQVKLSGHAVFVTVVNPTFVDQHVPVEHDLFFPRVCIEIAESMRSGEEFYSKTFCSPRLPPKVVFRPNLHHVRQDPTLLEARKSYHHNSRQHREACDGEMRQHVVNQLWYH